MVTVALPGDASASNGDPMVEPCGPLWGDSHYGSWLESTLDKLSPGEQGRSPLKYMNCGLCISLERKVYPLEESLDFH
jgi:hypothetical protein